MAKRKGKPKSDGDSGSDHRSRSGRRSKDDEPTPFIREVGSAGLTRYEMASGALALSNAGDLKSYSLGAIRELFTYMGLDPDDAMVGNAIQESVELMKAGQGLSHTATMAIQQYAHKHQLVENNTTVEEYVAHINPELSDEDVATIAPYAGTKLGEIENISDKAEREKVETVMARVKQHYNVGKLVGEYLTKVTQPNYKPGNGLESKL